MQPDSEAQTNAKGQQATGGGARAWQRARRHLGHLALPLALIALLGVLSLTSEHFLTRNNVVNALNQATVLGFAAVGMTFVIIGGGLDLSVGSVAALTGMIAALAMTATGSALAGVLAALGTGAACGMTNGLLVARLRVSPFIATLGMLVIARGLALAVTDSRPLVGLPPGFTAVASGQWLGLPLLVWLFLIVFGAAWVLLHFTTLGLQVYAVGGNLRAGRLAGLAVQRVVVTTYVISGLTAAAAGLVLAARLRSGQPTVGVFLELFAVAAVVLGGNSLRGGRGSLLFTLVGVLIIAFLQNGMNLLNIDYYYQQVALALILVLTAASELLRGRYQG